MAANVFDLFKIGIGPSSSHTVGPMRAALFFASELEREGLLSQCQRIKSELFGSLGATGKGHGSDLAVLMGFCGEAPDTVDPDCIQPKLTEIRESKKLNILGQHIVNFTESTDLILHKRKSLSFHPNGMRFEAFDDEGNLLSQSVYFSVGGGFVVNENAIVGEDPLKEAEEDLPYPFKTGKELLAICAEQQMSISDVMLENEAVYRPEQETRAGLLEIWQVMKDCVKRGTTQEGILPGGMKVKRRAAKMREALIERPEKSMQDPLTVLDWVNLYALAVNEENAAGGRVVTAPTNGAAGIVPAVLHYYKRFVSDANDDGVVRFLLTAGAIGLLFKENASISGAEVGCQGEVGSACAMAAGALCEVLGGNPMQVENAAEIGIEHNLGLTCDPVGGLVQVPCIERNAMGAIKAVNAARISLRGDGKHFVSLDEAIKTMKDTGKDMKEKYKETSRGGLAINVIEVPVNIVEC
jgi:L-serine dehydratase